MEYERDPKIRKNWVVYLFEVAKNIIRFELGIYAIIQSKLWLTNTTLYILLSLSDNPLLLFSLKSYVSQVLNCNIIFSFAVPVTITVIE